MQTDQLNNAYEKIHSMKASKCYYESLEDYLYYYLFVWMYVCMWLPVNSMCYQ